MLHDENGSFEALKAYAYRPAEAGLSPADRAALANEAGEKLTALAQEFAALHDVGFERALAAVGQTARGKALMAQYNQASARLPAKRSAVQSVADEVDGRAWKYVNGGVCRDYSAAVARVFAEQPDLEKAYSQECQRRRAT